MEIVENLFIHNLYISYLILCIESTFDTWMFRKMWNLCDIHSFINFQKNFNLWKLGQAFPPAHPSPAIKINLPYFSEDVRVQKISWKISVPDNGYLKPSPGMLSMWPSENIFHVQRSTQGWLPATATTSGSTSHNKSCDRCRYSSPGGLLSTQWYWLRTVECWHHTSRSIASVPKAKTTQSCRHWWHQTRVPFGCGCCPTATTIDCF